MDYKRIYDQIISNRIKNKFDGYTEKHHIIPRCLGGSNDKKNLVELTAREHFICHLLLTKIYKGTNKQSKMINAFMMMLVESPNQERYFSSHNYEKLKKVFAKNQSKKQKGKGNSQYNTMWTHSLELRQNKRIKKDDIIPDGWMKGRIINFEEYFLKKEIRKKCIHKHDINVSLKKLLQLKEQSEKTKEKRERDIKQYVEWYEIYNKFGWKTFVQMTNYPYSKQNFVMRCSKLVENFIPQNGKFRGAQVV